MKSSLLVRRWLELPVRSLAVPNLHRFGSNQPTLASVVVIAFQAAVPGTCEIPDLRLDSMLELCLHIAVTTLSLGLYPTVIQGVVLAHGHPVCLPDSTG